MKPRRSFLFCPASAAIAFSMSMATSQAAPLSWDASLTPVTPSGGTGTWNLANTNWSNGATDQAWTDTTGTADTATFGGTAGTVTLGSNLGALGLVFNTTGYTISGANTISLGTGGIDASALSSGTTTISSLIALVGGQSWNVGTGHNLAVSGVVSGSGALAKTGAGTLTLSGVNTFSGGLMISQGNLSYAANTALGGTGGTTGAVTINGGTLVSTSGATVTNTHAITIGASGGAMTIGAGQLFFNTANTLLGSGTLTVNGGGTLVANSGNLRVAQANTFNGNVVVQNGGNFEFGVANAIANTSVFTVNNQGEVIVNNGVTMSNAITVAGGTNSVISFENGNTGTYSGTVTLNANAIIGLRDWYNYATVRNGTISGKVTGTGGLTVNSGSGNGGILTLSNTGNDYTGATTINASRVVASSIGTGAITIGGTNGQLQLNGTQTLANSITINGGGVTAQGALHVAAGTVTVSGPINLTAVTSAGAHFASADNLSKLVISGNNSITTSAAVPVTVRLGQVVYTGSQNYTTGTTIGGGLLQFGKVTSMPASGAVSVSAASSGATLAVNAGGAGEFTDGTGTSNAGTIGGLLAGVGGQGAAVTYGTNVSIGIDTTNATGDVTYGSAFTTANNLGLLKLGTGNLVLSAGGTFAGAGSAGFPLVVRAGNLRFNGGTYAVTGEAVVGDNVAAGNAGTNASLTLDSATMTTTGFVSVARGNGVGGVSSDLVLNGTSQLTSVGFGIGFNNGSAANLPKGTVTLNGTSKITNNANSNAFNIAESAGSVGTLTLNDSSTVQHNGAAAVTRVGINGKGLLNVNSATATFNGRAFTLGTAAGGTGAVYNKGVLTMSQGIFIGDNNVAGATSSGYLRNDNAGAAASSVPQIYVGALSNATSTSHSVFDNVSGTLGTLSSGLTMSNGGTAGVQNSQVNVLGGTVASTTTTMNASGTNKFSNINVSGATSLYTNTGAVSLSTGGDVSNTGLLTVNNGGTFSADTITAAAAANTFINLDNGTLRAQVGTTASFVGSGVDRITVYAGGGTFDTGTFNKSVDTVITNATGNGVTSISLNTTGTGYVGRPVVKITDATGTGATAIANFDPTTGQVTGVTITSAGSGYTAPVITILGGGGTAVTATGTLASVAGGGISKTGTGTLTLNAANTYTGATQVSGGVLKAGIASVAGVSGAFGKNSAVTLANTTGTGIDITGFNTQIGSLAGGGATGGTVTLGAATLTTGADNTSTSFGGGISGTGGLTKIGSGTQTLTGTNLYTGATLVSAGKLVVNGTLANTTTTIASGATLGGGGTIGGATTISSGAHLAPGNSPGILTFSNGLALAAGGVVDWELTANTAAGAGTNFDQISVTGGTLTLATGALLNLQLGGTVDFTNGFWDSNQQWKVVDLSGTDGTAGEVFTLGTITGGAGDYTAEGAFSVTNIGGSQYLNWAAVPEPGTALLGGFGMLLVLRRRRAA